MRFRRRVQQAKQSTDRFSRSTVVASKSVNRLARNSKKAYTTLGLMYDRLKLIAATGIAFGAVWKFGQLFKDIEMFNRALRNSQAIMSNLTGHIKKEMRETALEVAKTTRFSAEEAAKAFYYLTSAGLDAAQAIRSLPAVARFGQAGMFDLSKATELLTDAQSALGMKVKDVEKNYKNMVRVSDVLIRATQLADATTEQFAEALTTRAAAAMKMYNIPLEEGVALLAAYADQNLKGAIGGRAMDIMLRDLSVKVQENAAAFEAAGIKVYTATGQWRPLPDVVRSLEDAYSKLTPKGIKALQMTLRLQQRSVAFQNVVIGMSEKMREWGGELKRAGTTMDVAAGQLTPFQKAWERLEGSIMDAGGALTRFIRDVAGGIEVLNEFAAVMLLLRSKKPGEAGFVETANVVMRATIAQVRENLKQWREERKQRAKDAAFRPQTGAASRRPAWQVGPRTTDWRHAARAAMAERQMANTRKAAAKTVKDMLAEQEETAKRIEGMTKQAQRWFDGTRTSAERFVSALEDIKRVAREIDFTKFGGVKTLQKQLEVARTRFKASIGIRESARDRFKRQREEIRQARKAGILGMAEAFAMNKQLAESLIEQMGGTRMAGKSVLGRNMPMHGLISGTQVGGMAGARVLSAASTAQAKELTELREIKEAVKELVRETKQGGMRQ